MLEFNLNGGAKIVVSEDEYAAIQKRNRLDKRSYVSQATDLIKLLQRTLFTLVMGIPILTFWAALIGFIAEPYQMRLLAELVMARPDEFSRFLLLIMFLTVAVALPIGIGFQAFGCRNRFAEADDKALSDLHFLREGSK